MMVLKWMLCSFVCVVNIGRFEWVFCLLFMLKNVCMYWLFVYDMLVLRLNSQWLSGVFVQILVLVINFWWLLRMFCFVLVDSVRNDIVYCVNVFVCIVVLMLFRLFRCVLLCVWCYVGLNWKLLFICYVLLFVRYIFVKFIFLEKNWCLYLIF